MNLAKRISSPKLPLVHLICGMVLIALCCLVAPSTAFAQFTAGVQGNIQDVGGANIPNAQMILLNTATKVQQAGTSDGSGLYRFTSLGPGDYEISAAAKGFTSVKERFTLTAGQIRDVSLKLNVGSEATSVTVTGESPILDTADSREQLTLGQTGLENLPLATRNPVSLLAVTPGVTGIQPPTTTFNPETTNHYSAGGRGGNANTFIVDGLDVDSVIGEGVTNLTPNVDSLSEVTIQTNTFDVDYGKSSSIETLMSSRPGTAEYHGFASAYYTYQGLSARGEYGVPQPTRLSPYHTTDLSFGVGGPIIPNKGNYIFGTQEVVTGIASRTARSIP